MYNRIEVKVSPNHWVGVLSAVPWIALLLFVLAIAAENSLYFLIFCVPALLGGWHQYLKNGLLTRHDSVASVSVIDDQLYVEQRNGQCYQVYAAANSRLYPRLAILKLPAIGSIYQSRFVIMCSLGVRFSNVCAEDFRKLRVWLRLGPSGRTPQKPH